MKKHLANIVSGSRIVGAFILLLFNDFTVPFLIIYCFCAFTDLIDGPIARKTGSTSILGAVLDTAGDGFVSLAMLKIFLVKKMVPLWMMGWLCISIGILVIAAFYSKKKFNRFYIPHTYVDKLFGGTVYLMPLIIQFVDPQFWMFVNSCILSVAAVETLAIQIKSDTAKDFVPSIFHVNK